MDQKIPVVGEDIYVGSSFYIDRGEDDFAGGLCKIVKVSTGRSAGQDTFFVEVSENPGTSHNWNYLLENQEKWQRDYGNRRGYPDPDC